MAGEQALEILRRDDVEIVFLDDFPQQRRVLVHHDGREIELARRDERGLLLERVTGGAHAELAQSRDPGAGGGQGIRCPILPGRCRARCRAGWRNRRSRDRAVRGAGADSESGSRPRDFEARTGRHRRAVLHEGEMRAAIFSAATSRSTFSIEPAVGTTVRAPCSARPGRPAARRARDNCRRWFRTGAWRAGSRSRWRYRRSRQRRRSPPPPRTEERSAGPPGLAAGRCLRALLRRRPLCPCSPAPRNARRPKASPDRASAANLARTGPQFKRSGKPRKNPEEPGRAGTAVRPIVQNYIAERPSPSGTRASNARSAGASCP